MLHRSLLAGKGLETFLPKYTNRVRRNGRLKDIQSRCSPMIRFLQVRSSGPAYDLVTPA